MKMHRVVLYVMGHNGVTWTPEEIKANVESGRGFEFACTGEISTCDIGEWEDRHPLNYRDGDFEEWFSSPSPLMKWAQP